MTDTIPTHTMTTTTMTAVATLSVAACIPATAGGFDRSRSADNMLDKKLAGAAGGFSWALAKRPLSCASRFGFGPRLLRFERYLNMSLINDGYGTLLTSRRYRDFRGI